MKVLKIGLYTVLVLAVIAVGGLAYLGQSSQNGSAPGLVAGQLKPCPEAPNCVSSEALTPAEKFVDPFAADEWDSLPQAIAAMGGVVTAENENYLAAEFTSATFGFVDDVEFRLAEDVVHLRSGSRVGYSDRGVNSARVAALRAQLNN